MKSKSHKMFYRICTLFLSIVLITSVASIARAEGPDSGTYTAGIFGPNEWSTLSWTEVRPDGTDVVFEVRSAELEEDVETAEWEGPYTNPSGIDISHHASYLQYRITLSTEDDSVTPWVTSVSIQPVGMYAGGGSLLSTVITPTSLESWGELTFDVDLLNDTLVNIALVRGECQELGCNAIGVPGQPILINDFDDGDIDDVDDGSFMQSGTIFNSISELGSVLRFADPIVDMDDPNTFFVRPSIFFGEVFEDAYFVARVRLNTTNVLNGETVYADNIIFSYRHEGTSGGNSSNGAINSWLVLETGGEGSVASQVDFFIPTVYWDDALNDGAGGYAPLLGLEFLVDWVKVFDGVEFDLVTSPIDLSGLDVVEYPELRLYAYLQTDDSSVTPSLNSWGVSWNVVDEGEQSGDDDDEVSSGDGSQKQSARRVGGGGSSGGVTGSLEALLQQLLFLLQQLLEQLLAEQSQ